MTDRSSCSSPDAKELIEQLIWEGVGETVAWKVFPDRVPDVTAAGKAHFKITLQAVATVPGQNGARPTCEATIVATDAQDLDPNDGWMQSAARTDASVRVQGPHLQGGLQYTVQPSDDGQSVRVSATGVDSFALALAGFSVGFSNSELYARREAEKAAKTAPATEAGAAALPPGAPVPAGATAAEQQSGAEDRFATADKELNAAYATARARLDDAGKAALRDEQRAWIKTRDATCSEGKISAESGGDVAGGSAMALEIAGCKARLTEERAKQLEAKR
ncbi:lysozyme inhibitor LprI family protein [Variovorax paradoxus]|uniref:lysozyme inhibitor LprI family protein n=1 Tax=Variovorax paradoxus TaxID=34073 RepID=UPI001ABD3A6B